MRLFFVWASTAKKRKPTVRHMHQKIIKNFVYNAVDIWAVLTYLYGNKIVCVLPHPRPVLGE